MEEKIAALSRAFEEELSLLSKASEVEALRVKYLGRKGPVQSLMKLLKEMTPEERPRFGEKINTLKTVIESKIEQAEENLLSKEEESRLESEKIDITLPGRLPRCGHKHPLTAMIDEIVDILVGMGFTVQYAPDIDTDYYNFEALNFSPDHPARDMQDTFYLTDKLLLRTQTTNIQVHVMESHKPPLRIVTPGKCYRTEAISARSHVFFHQVDGFYIDKGVTFANLFGTFDEFLHRLFKKKLEVRYRASFFPFVEPGLECDIQCLSCGGGGCQLCKYSGWLEICGAGMIHPEVLRNGGIDPEVYSGYAWGMGVERLAMLKYGIKDIRLFTQNDLRFLNQFTAVL